MITVDLSWAEVLQAAHGGLLRRVASLRDAREPAHGLGNGQGWEQDIVGAIAEFAFAKGVDRCPRLATISPTYSGDLANKYEIRGTPRPTGRLILHPADPDDRPFILVTGGPSRFVIRGWLYGHEGKRDLFWSEPISGRPAYFVPADELHPIETLFEVNA